MKERRLQQLLARLRSGEGGHALRRRRRRRQPECVGTALAADVMRARRVPYGVRVDDGGIEPGAVGCAWEELEAQAVEKVNKSSMHQGGQLKCEIVPASQLSAQYLATLREKAYI
uniref:Uncharacterized protein n=1 Tax=Haptolina brevifila TaxID=156173 RepID=A0A7S2HUW2_9EUKA